MDRVAPKNAANIWRLAARQKQRRQREVTTPFNWRLAFRAHIKVGRGRSPEADCVAACTPRPTNPPRSVLHGCSVVSTLLTYAISPHVFAPLRRQSTLGYHLPVHRAGNQHRQSVRHQRSADARLGEEAGPRLPLYCICTPTTAASCGGHPHSAYWGSLRVPCSVAAQKAPRRNSPRRPPAVRPQPK